MNRQRNGTLVFDTKILKKELIAYNQEIYKQIQQVLKEQAEQLKEKLRQDAPFNLNNSGKHYADSFVVDVYPLEVYVGNTKQVNGASGTRSRPPLINILNAQNNQVINIFESQREQIENNIINHIIKITKKEI